MVHVDPIHPNPVILAKPYRLARAAYDKLIELGFFERQHVELIHGTLVEMSPIGPAHRTTVNRLNKLLLPRLLDRAEVAIQQPIVAWDESEPEPDVSIVPLGDYSRELPSTAHLVIEVADASLAYDRETKAALYAATGIPEYWIANLVERVLEVYSEPRSGRYTTVTRLKPGAQIAPAAFPDVVLDVAEILRGV